MHRIKSEEMTAKKLIFTNTIFSNNAITTNIFNHRDGGYWDTAICFLVQTRHS